MKAGQWLRVTRDSPTYDPKLRGPIPAGEVLRVGFNSAHKFGNDGEIYHFAIYNKVSVAFYDWEVEPWVCRLGVW